MASPTWPADDSRVTIRRPGPPDADGDAVVYWMQRAQRARDNPALDAAIAAANQLNKPVVVLFVLVPDYPSANRRHYRFMLEGLRELPAALEARRIGFVVRVGSADEVPRFCAEVGAALLVGDENPLREPERWRQRVAAAGRVPFWTVDADVVVPSALLEKEHYSAATIRPRLHRQLEWFLRPSRDRRVRVPWNPEAFTGEGAAVSSTFEEQGRHVLDRLSQSHAPSEAAGLRGGAAAARARLRAFLRSRLRTYDEQRNQPAREATSGLSPYLHFGQIGPLEIALAVRDADAPLPDRQAFIEQLVVRRELAVNFVKFNPRYDSLEGCERWARATLDRHRGDQRSPVYGERQLEEAETHDPLWNAAQRQVMESGWMHGYVRMYWAKKILEWSRTPEEAFAAAIALNDRYEVDGRDPNGYAGIAWAVGGKHDRPWPERAVFGTIRYMSFASTSRKFDSAAYMRQWLRPGEATATTRGASKQAAAIPLGTGQWNDRQRPPSR